MIAANRFEKARLVKRQNRINKTFEDRVIDFVVGLVMLVVFVVTVYPFWYCLVLSFNNGTDASLGGIFLWPRKFSLENYLEVFGAQQLYGAFGVTIARTLTGTLASLCFTGLVAFAVSHKNLVFRNVYLTMMIISMYFGGGLIPYFILLKNLQLYNTFWVYIIPSLFGIWNCILMMNFFRAIPESLEESARIDGANELTIFFRIIVPVSMPVLATIALFSGVGHWNDWYTTAFFTRSRDMRTAAYILKELISQANLTAIVGSDAASTARMQTEAAKGLTAESMRMATMIVIVTPIVCVYPFLQRFFVKGVMIGSVKG